MKKVVIAFVAGALLMVSGQALAESISQVGKKVGGEAIVELNDTQLSNAIIVDGKSYAPVRDIAESFGADVEFEGATKESKAVIKLITTTDGSEMPAAHKLVILNEQRGKVAEEITRRESANTNLLNDNAIIEKDIEGITQEWAKDIQRAKITSNNAIIAENEVLLVDLKAQLAEIDKQIAELESAQ
ncbi:hypothetical protein [Paenibacillus harenae]|uniref:hypothetical protein n=1 Tax=Paenibacillus harenae TaxID=306543 RepID=UPI002791FD3D|nr:hypothetical protein [Paenibacillus harenae]MDQ0062390.1 hypothetical protein [Paenibacillus harenae]